MPMEGMEALQGLIQPQPQTQAQQIGGMFQGLGAAFSGRPDPRIAQQEMELRQRSQLMQVQDRVDRQRAEKNKIQMEIGKEFLNQDSPEAKKIGARIYAQQLKSMGVDPNVTSGLEKSLGGSPLSMDQRKQVYLSIRTGATDDYLTKHLNVDPGMIAQLRTEAQGDEVYKLLYGKTPLQEKIEMDKADLAQRKADRDDLAMKLKEIEQQRKEAKDQAMQREWDARHRETQQKLDEMVRRTNIQQANLDYKLANGPQAKKQAALDGLSLFIDQFKEFAGKINDEGYLPKTSKGVLGGDITAMTAMAKRKTDPYGPDWVTFTQHLRGQMINYTRNVQQDIGPRFKAAFDGAIDLMVSPPSYEALMEVAKRMDQAMEVARKGWDTALEVMVKHRDGSTKIYPWKPGMQYDEGDRIIGIK